MKRLAAALAFLLTVECGALEAQFNPRRPECITTCGVTYYGSVDGGALLDPGFDCAAVQRIEDAAIENFASYVTGDDRFARSCPALNGWYLYMDPDHVFVDPFGRRVHGYAWCELRTMHVGSALPGFRTALAHELAHAVQFCQPFASSPTDPDHAEWRERGIYRAVEASP